jgi:uncharacterized protein YdhG (YjbR/CyaY superfamily)
MARHTTIDEYIALFSPDVQERLEEIRNIVKQAAPGAEEGISYGIAAYKFHGKYFIYFGGFKYHSSLFPFPSGIEKFQKAAKGFKTAKGTIQFPHDKKLPVGLMKQIVTFRMKEMIISNLEKAHKGE